MIRPCKKKPTATCEDSDSCKVTCRLFGDMTAGEIQALEGEVTPVQPSLPIYETEDAKILREYEQNVEG